MRWTDATANESRRWMGSAARVRQRGGIKPDRGISRDGGRGRRAADGAGIAGAALVARGRAVHVSAFPQRG